MALPGLLRILLVPFLWAWDVAAGMRAVMERDFLVFTSQGRFLAIRTAAVVIPAIVVAAVLMNKAGATPDSIGKSVLLGATVTVPALVLLLAPALSAGAIAGERSTDTLDIVLAAPVRPLSFVLAKFFSRLLVVLVLVFASLPISSIALVYGGVSVGLFLEATALALGFAVFGVAAGILTSAYSRTVGGAVLGAYALVLLLPALWLAGVALVFSTFFDAVPGDVALSWLALSPYFAWVQTAGSIMGIGTATSGGWLQLAVAAIGAVIVLIVATARISRESATRARGGGKRRRGKHTMFLDNPVIDQAVRGSLLRRPRMPAWLVLAVALIVEALILWAAFEDGADDWELHVIALCVITTIASFQVLASAAGAVASERKSGSLDLLLATPFRYGDVTFGKLCGVLLGVVPLMAIGVIHGVVALPATEFTVQALCAWLAVSGVVLTLFAGIGMRVSIGAATPGRAVLKTFAIVFGGTVLHLVGLFLVAIIVGGGDDEIFLYITASPALLMWMAPMFVADMAADAGSNSSNETVLAASALWTVIWGIVGGHLMARAGRALDRSRDDA